MTSLFLNKILPVFFLPLGLSLLLVLVGLVFRRRVLATAGLVLLWVLSLPVVADSLLAGLEGPVGRVAMGNLRSADAVVVLSGMIREMPGAPLGEWGDAVDRFEAGVAVWQAGKAPYLVFTGGWLPWRPAARPEGEILQERAARLGVPAAAMLVTGKVGNTAAEALAVFDLLHNNKSTPSGREAPRIILVTSAFHMPRAGALFKKAGFAVQTYPVDFYQKGGGHLTPQDFLPSAAALQYSELVFREWLGMAFYRLTAAM
ncbi:MAG: YdcF family protein [Desulfobulbaceae bacterium]|nr:MAG: YdcF family protein [Desulfobulbaceae bacterium]